MRSSPAPPVLVDRSKLMRHPQQTKKETKTLGLRTTPASHLIASGPYLILLHPSSTSDAATSNPTSLVYRTTVPKDMGEVQKAFNIAREGSFTVTVKVGDRAFRLDGDSETEEG